MSNPTDTTPTTDLTNPQQMAEACRDAMYVGDRLTQQLEMQILSVGPGQAELRMQVQPWMTNGHDTCHGGMIFSLADSAFAYACNSENRVTVASGVTIDYVSPGRTGDLLTARASRCHERGRTGVYDVQVTNQKNELIALFRGRSHTIRGAVVPGTEVS